MLSGKHKENQDVEGNDQEAATGSEHEEEEAAAPSSSKQQQRRWSKSALYAAYKGKGPHLMTFDFLHDNECRDHLCIIQGIGQRLHWRYVQDLDAQKTRIGRLSWAAQRSTVGSSITTVLSILEVLSNEAFQKRLGLLPKVPGTVLCATDPIVQHDVEMMKLATKFAINVASNFCWSEQLYAWTLPVGAASLLAESNLAKVFRG